MFSDADFAGDKELQRSTSGVFLALYGPHSFFPLSAQSKKQTATSHSTVEAEIIAADHAIRTAGLPALPVWETILDRSLSLDVYQDNQATARIMSSGRAPTLRHIKRTHQVSVAWLHERVTSPDVVLHDCVSEVMAADIFTKHFISKDKWEQVCGLIGVVTGKHVLSLQQHAKRSPTACPAVSVDRVMAAPASQLPWSARAAYFVNEAYAPRPRPTATLGHRPNELSAPAEARGRMPGSSGDFSGPPPQPQPQPLLRPRNALTYARKR